MAIQDGLVGNGRREVRLAPAGAALEDEAAAVGGEFGSDGRAEQDGLEPGLDREVEFLEGAQDGEAGLAHAPAQARATRKSR